MNVNQNISKLIIAFSVKGKQIKINQFGFWAEKGDIKKYCHKYVVYMQESIDIWNYEEGKVETTMKYVLKEEFYKKVELLKYLVEEYKKIGSEADGRGI